jgi:hypothetical protein
VLTDILEELVMSIFTLDMAHDLEDGGASAIISDLLNSQLFMEICSSDFNEYEDVKGDEWCSMQRARSQLFNGVSDSFGCRIVGFKSVNNVMQELHASERWQLSNTLGYLEYHISESIFTLI